MIDLNSRLTKINWLYKSGLYDSFLESVIVQKEVVRPSISVVVISWQYNDQMLQNFISLQKQRDANFELIFVNNGKADDDFAAILPYVDTYVRLNANTGAYKARNIGSLFANAPILFFLEDDGVADTHLVMAHLESYRYIDIISARGVCKPLNTNNKLNKRARHYYLGNRPFPRFGDLEGNVSYTSEAFYAVGGWSDDIEFGHGGLELSIRLNRKYPDKRLQIYAPEAVIFHDYARDADHLKAKLKKQQETLAVFRNKYPEWDTYVTEYRKLHGQTHQLHFLHTNTCQYRKFYVQYLIGKVHAFLTNPATYGYYKIKHLIPKSLLNLIKGQLV